LNERLKRRRKSALGTGHWQLATGIGSIRGWLWWVLLVTEKSIPILRKTTRKQLHWLTNSLAFSPTCLPVSTCSATKCDLGENKIIVLVNVHYAPPGRMHGMACNLQIRPRANTLRLQPPVTVAISPVYRKPPALTIPLPSIPGNNPCSLPCPAQEQSFFSSNPACLPTLQTSCSQ
jgi:hypothetical protein